MNRFKIALKSLNISFKSEMEITYLKELIANYSFVTLLLLRILSIFVIHRN